MNVLVMRRNLTSDERLELQRLYPGQEIHDSRIDPNSADEHLELCRHKSADLIFLPHEQPIPVMAMLTGFKHVQLKEGQLQELVRVVPEFKNLQVVNE